MGNIELFVTHGKMCHHFCTNNQEEVQIEECDELYSDHEEADTRLLLHAKQASRTHSHVIIRSPDTDVFILLLGHKSAIPTSLYFDTGIGNQRRILDISKAFLTLGFELCDALIGFHAFTGLHFCLVLSLLGNFVRNKNCEALTVSNRSNKSDSEFLFNFILRL